MTRRYISSVIGQFLKILLLGPYILDIYQVEPLYCSKFLHASLLSVFAFTALRNFELPDHLVQYMSAFPCARSIRVGDEVVKEK
jgi:hypothetical protein